VDLRAGVAGDEPDGEPDRIAQSRRRRGEADDRAAAVEQAAHDVSAQEVGPEVRSRRRAGERRPDRRVRIVRSDVPPQERDGDDEHDDGEPDRAGADPQEPERAPHAGSLSFGTSSITIRSATRFSMMYTTAISIATDCTSVVSRLPTAVTSGEPRPGYAKTFSVMMIPPISHWRFWASTCT